MTAPATSALPVQAADGHRFELQLTRASSPRATLLFLPALGVTARHYQPLAQALAGRGIDVAVHEWRGHGSSSLRAGRRDDWGFAELLGQDLPASLAALAARGLPAGVLGGHSLGGQLACVLAGLHPEVRDLWLVGAGSPWYRAFPAPLRWKLPLAYTLLPLVAVVNGHLPGRHLGFGGREARTLIADWARVGRSGHYRIPAGIAERMAAWPGRCHGVVLANDWMAPPSSLSALQALLASAATFQHRIEPSEADPQCDHFSWMRAPEAVADRLAGFAKEFSQNR